VPAPEVKKLVSKHVPAIADAVSCWRGSRVSTSNDCGECVPSWCGELPWKQTNYRRALPYFRLQEPVLDKGDVARAGRDHMSEKSPYAETGQRAAPEGSLTPGRPAFTVVRHANCVVQSDHGKRGRAADVRSTQSVTCVASGQRGSIRASANNGAARRHHIEQANVRIAQSVPKPAWSDKLCHAATLAGLNLTAGGAAVRQRNSAGWLHGL
jgi:hypothetical protein